MNDRGLLDLVISLLPGLRLKDTLLLLKTFDSEGDFIVQSKTDIEKIIGRELKSFWDVDKIRIVAASVDKMCRMRSIQWVSWTDKAYPPLLREIYDPPPVIFYRGKLPDPRKPLLGMVGTRKPSPEGAGQAYSIALGIAKSGFSVVSGLALGIDSMAHRGNLNSGVPGYAILGSGTDEIYPSSNRPLAKKILDCGGALISEYPPGTHPFKRNFPARNRIISGLSRSVLIVEAPKKSGSLITAAFALDQGRDLWVASSGLQHSALYDKEGTVKLADDGAEIIYSEFDILEKWNIKKDINSKNVGVPKWDTTGRDLVSSMANFLEIDI